jgi:Tfp pilus assembly protein PilO
MIKNLPKEKRDQLLLICIITLAITLGAYFGLVKMQKRKLERIAKQSSEQEEKVGGAARLVATHKGTEEDLQDNLEKLKAIEQQMASGDMYSWIIQTVNRFRADRKVEIPQFSREITTEVGVFPKFPYKAALFHIRGTAYFHELGRFVADFENAFPHIRIQNIDMEAAAQSAATTTPNGDPEKLAFKMEIVALINPNVAQ